MHKKKLAVLAVLSCLVLPQTRANDIEPGKEFYTAIHKGAAPVVVDGKLDEWTGVPVLSDPKFAIPKGAGPGGEPTDQTNPSYVLFEPYAGGTWTGPDDQTSAVEVVWDADNVYLGFIVTDDYHENSAHSAWNGDSVQLMVSNSSRSGTQGVGFFLYNFALGGTEDALDDPSATIVELEAPAPNAVTGTDVEAIVTRDTTAKKTYYEIRLSATALGLPAGSLAAGSKFGLGMAINDGDQDQPGQKGWGGLGAHAIVFGKTPDETALVTLSDQTPGSDIIFFSAVNPQIGNFAFRVNDKGTSISDPTSVTLSINGAPVTLTAGTKTGGAVDFTYTPTTPFPPGSNNTYTITAKDTNGQTATSSGSFITPQYAVLDVADKVTPDTAKRGFIFNISQNGGITENSYVRAIDQLAGRLGHNHADPAAQSTAIAPAAAPANAFSPITFEVDTVINFNIDPGAGDIGDFTADAQMPGTPGLDPLQNGDQGLNGSGVQNGELNGIAADIVYYVELTAGLHTFIVNSDDGFTTFVGPVNDVFKRKLAGQFDQPGGRGASDTSFQVFVPADGVYPFRTIFEQGGGGGNIELIEVLADGTTKVLMNDDASGASKVYRAATGPDVSGATAVASVVPAIGTTRADGNGSVTVSINEGSDAVDQSSIVLKIDGTTVPTTPQKTGSTITVTGKPAAWLTAKASHNASITFKAGAAAARTETWSFTTTRFPSGTLFIEAEDFNFGNGQYVTDQPIGMTGYYPGGSYQDKGTGLSVDPVSGAPNNAPCDGSDWGVDYNDNNVQDDPANTADYRPTTTVEAAKHNGSAGQDRGLFFVDMNHNLGWTSSAEWMNYTRDFPATGVTTYKVYARMAHGDNTAGVQRGGILMTVQGDTTKCDTPNQTTTELGRFAAPWTGGWDNWPDAGTPQDALIVMKDPTGADAVVRLQGHQTLRFQYALNAGDFDYLAFVPIDVPTLPVKVGSISPADGSFGASVNPLFTAVLQDQDLTVTGATLKLNGASVTPTITKSGKQTTVSFRPTTAVAPGSQNVYELTYTDSAGASTVQTVTFRATYTPLPTGTLFIEAEDFNFGHGQYDTANPIGMTGAYPGGTYQGKGDGLFAPDGTGMTPGSDCDGSDFGIDYHDNNSTSDQAVYRPNTPVEAGKRNGPAGFNRGTFDVQINHNLGWTDASEWMNYTRDFPTTGTTTYRVYARMAHGDSTAGVLRGGVLFTVAGDTTKCASTDQTTTQLGTFSAPWTGGWDSWPDAGTPNDALIPMQDEAGKTAVVTLSGHQTLRFQYANNAGDFDYLAFVPQVGPTPPTVVSISPTTGGPGAHIQTAFNATLKDEGATVTGATVKLDGVAVNATVNHDTTTGLTTVSFVPDPFAPNSTHKYTLTFTDSNGGSQTFDTPSFTTTFTPLPNGTLFIEAEDFNFGHGQYVTDQPIGMTGAYPGGAYQDKGDGILAPDAVTPGSDCDGSDFGIDFHDGNSTLDTGEASPYRSNSPVDAGKLNGSEGVNRGAFTVSVNHVVGWTDSSEWLNYTRDFPAAAQGYKVYARMAHGDGTSGVQRGGTLFMVSGDTTKCASTDQTTTALGSFAAPWTGGWDVWPDAGTPQDALIPMKDSSGNVATVTLSGKTTLRFQYALNAGDFDYLAFVPAGQVVTKPQITKTTLNANGSITVEWTGGGVLQTTTSIVPNATWTDVTGATSPFTFTPQANVPVLFGRVKQ